MRLTGIAALAAVLCLASPTVGAANEAPSSVEGTAASPRQLALSRRYIDLMQGDQLRAAVRTMVEGQVRSEGRNLPSADRRFLTDLTIELVADLVPAMMTELVPVYAAVFTEAELDALVTFYDSAQGRSIINKTYESLPEANAAMMVVVPRMLDKMAVRMCEHYGCDPVEMRALMYAEAGLPSPTGAVAPARRK